MRKVIIYICLLALPILTTSCYEDLGNYQYNDINEVSVNGIDSSYVAYQGENFKIKPELNFTLDQSGELEKYEYEWVLMNTGGLDTDREKVLSHEKDLDVELQVAPGKYDAHYKVFDKDTGVEFYWDFKVEVKSIVYEGWIVMSDVGGEARLDMASLIEDEYQVFPDVLSYIGSSLQLQGAPGLVYCYYYDPTLYGIYATSEGTGTTKIDPETFDWSEDLRLSYEAISNFPTNLNADKLYAKGGYSSFMIKDNNVYYYYRTYQVKYGAPINKVANEPNTFTASEFIAVEPSSSGHSILFDEDNKRFVRHLGANNLEVAVMPNNAKLFDYNIGMDLVYMSYSRYNNGEALAILNDGETFHIARMQQRVRNINQVYYEEISVPGFEQAENFAVQPDFGYLFFNIGTKVYEYDLSTKVAHEMLDMVGREITHMEFNSSSPVSSQLVVAVNDPTKPEGSTGSLEFYEIPAVNGQIVFDSKLEGFGKITGITYRSR
ncbi:PKD-like family lipoprotein [Algoriphagus halophytocola]|uniref:PKD-like family lipoprotein n=1 Tax=Algoriphagus halophytocola TaxID=2991499 RepID=A0ABY6MCF1_9BACT|nr:PKD-like family lipoprotein [Algoriphagus sp. TR-M5]UZD21138.1 PKD-like family lipoprotein [Algoriphagus sp. TR-M5]